jgi:hypothetical protein
MPISETCRQSRDTPGLLTVPPLTSPPPVKLNALCNALNLNPLRIKALRLLYSHFPAEMARATLKSEWFEVLVEFLRLVDHDWFDIDWDSLALLEEGAFYPRPEWDEALTEF